MSSLEIACFNSDSAIISHRAGASRIELCSNRDVGGTTPSLDSLNTIKDPEGGNVRIPVFVMIRPRGGDFQYSDTEFEMMKSAIADFRALADGFVFGMLREDDRGVQSVDLARNTELVHHAAGKPCTFHRAFDAVGDLEKALEDVIACGFRAILTSGGEDNAVAGIERLAELTKKAGERIVIMPGGGVRSTNMGSLRLQTGAGWYHSSGIVGEDEVVDVIEVKSMLELLQ